MSGAQRRQGRLTYDEAVTKYFLAQYVRAREGWLAAGRGGELPPGLDHVDARRSSSAGPTPSGRPTRRAPRSSTGRPARRRSRSAPSASSADGVANVRFHRIVRQAQQVTESDWIATVAFAYTRAPMAEADRLRNPLGFQVTSYRADPEVMR